MTITEYRDYRRQLKESIEYESIISRNNMLMEHIKTFDKKGFLKHINKEIKDLKSKESLYTTNEDKAFYYTELSQLEYMIRIVNEEN